MTYYGGLYLKYLFPFFKKYKAECFFAPLFKMLEAAFDLIVPLVVAKIINVGIVNGDSGYIFTRVGILILMALLGLACSFTAQYFAAKAATGTSAELRQNLLGHIQSLGFGELDKIGASTLITRLTADVNQVQNGLNMFLRLFLRSPFIVFGAMIMAFMIDFNTALIFAAVILVLFVIVFVIMFVTNPIYKKQQKTLDAVTTSTRENLAGVRVVRAFGKEKEEFENFKNINGALTKIQLHVGKISALMNPLTYVTVNLGIIMILKIGSGKIADGTLLSGDIVALVNYLSQILVELIKLANLIVLLSKAIVSMGRIGQVLDMPCDMKYGDMTESKKDVHEIIKFEDVSFRYTQSSEYALESISFAINKGETIGIIGGTGSGKSTLINLIARYYDASKGKISFMGEPVSEWDKQTLRRKISVVAQKTQLFSGTVRSNLLFGKKNATDEEMMHALEIAQAANFVLNKPKGLDCEVEQDGRNFSGGQKQRLSVARAVISDSDVLILDDSSSALDYATDAAMRKALKKLSPQKTVIIVSQRTSSIKHADRILVLDDGHLVGSGTHEELLADCEVYREIHESVTK